jgi:hypothetical protein
MISDIIAQTYNEADEKSLKYLLDLFKLNHKISNCNINCWKKILEYCINETLEYCINETLEYTNINEIYNETIQKWSDIAIEKLQQTSNEFILIIDEFRHYYPIEEKATYKDVETMTLFLFCCKLSNANLRFIE